MASENNIRDEDELVHHDLFWVDGFPLPVIGDMENRAKEIFSMKPRSDDIIVSTYPKCGTTWAQFIIWGILHEGAVPPNASVMMFKEFPFLELTGTSLADKLPSPRMLKLHLPYRLTPRSAEARYVTVMRNVFDCCISFYHHLFELDCKAAGKKIYKFEVYFDDFVKGNLPFGDYFDQVQSWYEHKDDPNVLFLTYEDMKSDTKGHVLKLAQFLGTQYNDKLENDPQMLNNIIKHSSFEYMKENKPFRMLKEVISPEEIKSIDIEELNKFYADPEKVNDDQLFRTVQFFRKGKVGSAKAELTDERWNILDRLIDERIKYPELRVLMRRTKIDEKN